MFARALERRALAFGSRLNMMRGAFGVVHD